MLDEWKVVENNKTVFCRILEDAVELKDHGNTGGKEMMRVIVVVKVYSYSSFIFNLVEISCFGGELFPLSYSERSFESQAGKKVDICTKSKRGLLRTRQMLFTVLWI